MTIHMNNEIEKLKKDLLALSSEVEEQLWLAVRSIKERDADLASKVINNDCIIDQSEVDLEEECLKVLALHQPVAVDLRYIITALKINSNLERISDLSVNIAERSDYLAGQQPVASPFDFERMAQITQTMLRKSINALINLDCDLAHEVREMDDQVDAINREMYEQVKKDMVEHPQYEYINSLIHLLSVSRHLERIADHVTSIAEDIIYMVEGKIIRHQPEDYK